LACEAGGWVIRAPVLKVLGDASYAIYLSHPFIIEIVIRALHQYPAPIRIITPIVIATGLGVCINSLVERPMTQKLRQFGAAVQRISARRTAVQPHPR
jgi:exopolysaccharide production protein ExoZ